MRLYRALLTCYPKSFRDEYGDEMAAIFERRRTAAGGLMARAWLWCRTAVEIAVNAAAVHVDITRQDVRYLSRNLGRAPGFALTSVLVMALGVGATTAVFSVTDYVMLRPLPFPKAHELVRLWQTTPGYGQMELSPATFRDWKARSTTLTAMGALATRPVNLTDGGDPVRLEGAAVTADVFDVFCVPPAIGRPFRADDMVRSGPRRVVLSDALWKSRFGAAETVIGRTIHLDGDSYEVIGVMPASFRFPRQQTAVWLPLPLGEEDYQDLNDNYLLGIGRLRQGASADEAQAEFTRIAGALEREHPVAYRQAGANVYRLRDGYSRDSQIMLLSLGGAAVCLLLIACVNLANLLLARGLSRRRELVVRAALGAGRDRLRRQLMTETMALAVVGGALGIAVASSALPLLTRLIPATLPMDVMPQVDLRVMTFALIVTTATGALMGLVPLLGARRSGFVELRDGGRAGGGRREAFRGALVVLSIVCAVVLLSGAGLLLRALLTVQSVPPGFDTRGILTMETALPMPKYEITEARVRWYLNVVDEIERLPGVSRAAFISFLPMTMRGGIWPVVIKGTEIAREEGQVASLRFVTPGFFETLGIPLIQGRDVTVRDTASAPVVAVVSRSFADRYWPGGPAIGQRFMFAFIEREVVGIVGDVRVRGLESTSEPQVYLPAGQVPDGGLPFYAPKDLVIRTASDDPVAILPAIRGIIRDLDPDQPISRVRLLADVVADETGARAVQLRVIGSFAVVALFLAGIGLHGLQAFTVSQRRREFGIRMSLGATRAEILQMVLVRGMRLAIIGLLPGLAIAFAAGRALGSLLAGVAATDAVTFGVVLVVVGGTALAGTAMPALRATRVDPAVAVRAE